MKKSLLLMMFLFLLTSPAHAGLKEGKEAYKNKNWFQAILNLRPLAKTGNAEAMVLLGNMYNDGNGVKKDPAIAFKHYQQAATLKNSNAMLAVGAMYLNSSVVKKDFTKGIEWITKSANHDNQDAQFFLGFMYLKGLKKPELEITEDKEKSYFWFKLASQHRPMKKQEQAYKLMAQKVAEESLTPEQVQKLDTDLKSWISKNSRLHPDYKDPTNSLTKPKTEITPELSKSN